MEEDFITPENEKSAMPKKRGRKPKSDRSENAMQGSAAFAKKRGRPKKNSDVSQNDTLGELPTAGEMFKSSGETDIVKETSHSPLDMALDTAVKQRRGRGRPPRTPREDGPSWRDTPVAEESRRSDSDDASENESGLFVHSEKNDDFAYNPSDGNSDEGQSESSDSAERNGEESRRNNDPRSTEQDNSGNSDDEIPTSFSTTDDDLNPESYRDAPEKDDETDDRIAEARTYENASDTSDEQQQERRDNRWQQRRDRWQQKRDNRNQNNPRQNQNNRDRNNNNRQDFRNGNRNQQQNPNQRQNFNQRQNPNSRNQQQQLRQNPNAQRQKKPHWMQNQAAESESINPADLPVWNAMRFQNALDDFLAQTFLGKPPFGTESFETAKPVEPVTVEPTSVSEPSEAQEQPCESIPQTETLKGESTNDSEADSVKSEADSVNQTPSEKEETSAEDELRNLPPKKLSDMNYWELMVHANDSAAQNLGLEKGIDVSVPKEEPVAEQTTEAVVETEKLPQQETQIRPQYEEPISVKVGEWGEIESLDGLDEIYPLGVRDIQTKFDERKIEHRTGVGKAELVADFYKHALAVKKLVRVHGTLDVFEDGFGGAIAFENDNFRLKKTSVYVPQMFIDKFALKRGHTIGALAMPPREGFRENCPIAVAITSVMDAAPETARDTVPFTDLTPYYPTRRIIMEADADSGWDNLSMRAVDLLTPVGFGQRALIVAPPRTGKTVLMQGMAKSIRRNAPKAKLMILLVDERPEEVTDFRRNVDAEVIASTFDEEATNHVHAAEMVISRARRLVECGEDVVILLDSITRLARAYNAVMPNGGRTMTGGVDTNALQKPKKFFGSARNIEGGGSLTIIGTALVETGSKMDDVIFEEFKGTGNLELHLDRGLSDKRIFPSINIEKSGTRKEELLYHPDEMLKIYALRRAMKGVPAIDAMELLVQRLKKVPNNIQFLLGLNR